MSSPPGSSAAATAPLGARAGGTVEQATPPFDVQRLLEASAPRGTLAWWFLALPVLGLAGLATAVVLMLLSPGRATWMPAAALAALAASAGAMIALRVVAGGAQRERQNVAQIDELITLRHFPPAAARLSTLLARPMRLHQHRVLALVQLMRTLMRYERYEEAIEVAEAVIQDPATDPALRFAMGCGRVMSMLRAGRLYDAGEAITQLRREVSRLDDAVRRLGQRARDQAKSEQADGGGDGPSELEPDDPEERSSPLDSVALTLVELYRDIQTRHNDEALQTVRSKRASLRDGLGMRLGDVLALASVAAHRLGEAGEARRLWAEATSLIPPVELLRRYPEVAEVDATCPATPRPAEAPVAGGGA